jgi:hypothetical protein
MLWATDTRELGAVRYDDRLLAWPAWTADKLPDLVPSAACSGRWRRRRRPRSGCRRRSGW